MYSEETKPSNLAKFLSGFDYVFLDTCSLMEDGFPAFMDTLVPSKEYWKEGLRVIVLKECIKELKKHRKSKEKNEARIGAIRALKILRHDKWHGKTIEIGKKVTGGDFADQAITQKVVELRIRNKILIITQDKTLTTDLLKFNKLDSQHGRYLEVYKILPNGDLAKNFGDNGFKRSYERNEKDKERRLSPSFKGEKQPQIVKKEEEKKEEKAVSPLVEADRRINSILRDPTYPLNKKIAEINSELSLLQSANDKDKTSLLYNEDRLLSEKEKLVAKMEKALPASEAKAEQKIIPEVKKEETPSKKEISKKEDVPHDPYENGNNSSEAIRKLAVRINALVRDDDVPYFEAVHGPLDLTNKVVEEASKEADSFKSGEGKLFSFGPGFIYLSHESSFYKAVYKKEKPLQTAPKKSDLAVLAPVKKTEEPLPKTVQNEQKPIEVKKEEDSSKPKAEKKKKTGKTSKKEEKPQLVLTENAVLPLGVNLYVGEPSAKGEHIHYGPLKKAKADDKPKGKTKPKSDKTKKSSEAKTAKTSKKVAEPVKKKAKATVKKETASTKAAQPKQAKKTAEVKKEAVKKASSKKSDPALLEEAILSEARLNANVNNPNYPLASKLGDLDAQIKRLKSLSASDKKKLKLTSAALNTKRKELSK